MTDDNKSIIDLSSLQGQVANLVLSLNGLQNQQAFDENYLNDNGVYTEDEVKKEFIHNLENLIKLGNESNLTGTSKGMSTYYISDYIYLALLTLNKYVNEVTYENGKKTSTNPIRPFAGTFSQDLLQIIKKDGFYKISKTNPNNPSSNDYYDLTFDKYTENKLNVTLPELKTREDLLDQTKFYTDGTYNYHNTNTYLALVPAGLTISESNFGANMRKLLTDLYKEYYYYEILDIQKRLNRKHSDNNSKLDAELRLLLQKARNAFTREIYNPDVDITSEFPMSDIMYELNDYVAEMENGDSYKDLELFNNGHQTEEEDKNTLSLYQFIEEKTHMMNMVGNAIHYGLELSKRIQYMKEFADTKNENIIIDENSRSETDLFSEDYCIKNIDESMAMIRNLVDDLRLLTGDFESTTENSYTSLHKSFETGEICAALSECDDIYHKFNELKNKPEFAGTSQSVLNDFNNNQLQQLKVLKILNSVYKSHDVSSKFNDTLNPNKIHENITTTSLFENTLVSRYNNPVHYKNYALLIIKIVIMLGILHNFRVIQTYNLSKAVSASNMTRNVHNSKILTALNKPLPKNLSVMEFVKIEELKKQLRKKLLTRDSKDLITFDLPEDINGTSENDPSLQKCFECILEIMNTMTDVKIITENTTSGVIDNLFKRFYPFTKSMLYQFDEYFVATEEQTANGEITGNKFNDDFKNIPRFDFNLLTNGLNYVAQGIISSGTENYTNEHYEKMLTKLIYLCNCITVNWSHKDEAEHNIHKLNQMSIYELFKEDFNEYNITSFADLLKTVSVAIHSFSFRDEPVADEEGAKDEPIQKTTSLTTKFINFIYEEMKTMIRSNLPLVVKYAYWVILYCINSYFIHLHDRRSDKVLISKTKEIQQM